MFLVSWDLMAPLTHCAVFVLFFFVFRHPRRGIIISQLNSCDIIMPQTVYKVQYS